MSQTSFILNTQDTKPFFAYSEAIDFFQTLDAEAIIADSDFTIIAANAAYIKLCGDPLHEGNATQLEVIDIEGKRSVPGLELKNALEQSKSWHGTFLNNRQANINQSHCISIYRAYDNGAKKDYYLCIVNDQCTLQKHEQQIQKIAQTDCITGLPNRLFLSTQMKRSLEQANHQEQMLAICYLDLDDFKSINDRYGYDFGNLVLKEVGTRLSESISGEDTVVRTGGDEFVLVIHDIQNLADFELKIDQLLSNVSRPIFHKHFAAEISASIGVAFYPFDDNEPDKLLRFAAQGMVKAKSEGKNCCSFFDKKQHKELEALQECRQTVAKAIINNEFVLFYQPKVNMLTGEVVGVEALIRWIHPEKGIILPGKFLPQLQNTYLIIEIGNWVLEQVMIQLSAWQNAGVDINVSVNISSLQLQQPEFFQDLTLLFKKYNDVKTSNLEFEILENATIDDTKSIKELMANCSEYGIEFSLDDFGTGYSSLSHLRQLPTNTIKIDRSFVSGMVSNQDDLAIIKGILSLTKTFKRKALAEGIETLEQGKFLLELGCILGQGFSIAKPMPATQVSNWIEQYQLPVEWQ